MRAVGEGHSGDSDSERECCENSNSQYTRCAHGKRSGLSQSSLQIWAHWRDPELCYNLLDNFPIFKGQDGLVAPSALSYKERMDPVVLATTTTALTVLATEVSKGTASAVGQEVWGKVKALFRWKRAPVEAEMAQDIAQQLSGNSELMTEILRLLQGQDVGVAHGMVGRIDAEKVVVVQTMHVAGDFNL